jgi:PAS domain-containing protein
MTYERLADFVQNRMRMSHVYQPVMRVVPASLSLCDNTPLGLGGSAKVSMQPSDFGELSRRTQGILRESEERFRLLVEGVKDYAIFILDTDGYITTWNLGAQRIKGYEAEEIIGEHSSIFYTEEDVEREHPEEELRIAAAAGQY